MATTLMDLYMKAECGGFLHAAVLETVLRLLESKQSAELNPTKMDSLDDACNNAEFLLQILDQVSSFIKYEWKNYKLSLHQIKKETL